MDLLKLYITLIVFSLHFASQGQSTWVSPDSAKSVKNPVAENDEALTSGKTAFEAICFVCHGNQGKGDGVNAPNLERPPADLTAVTVQVQSDGELFWKISEGNPPMLSFKNALSEEQRWQLVHYIRELARLYPPQATVEASSATAQQGITSHQSNTNEFKNADSKSLPSANSYLITIVVSVLVVILVTLVVLIYTLNVVMMVVKD